MRVTTDGIFETCIFSGAAVLYSGDARTARFLVDRDIRDTRFAIDPVIACRHGLEDQLSRLFRLLEQ